MQPDEIERLARGYVEKWKPRLFLGSRLFRVDVLDKKKLPKKAYAEADAAMHNYHAVIKIANDILERAHRIGDIPPGYSDEDYLEWIVLHELLHVTEQPLNTLFLTLMYDHIDDKSSLKTLEKWWDHSREWWIDNTARALFELDREMRRGNTKSLDNGPPVVHNSEHG